MTATSFHEHTAVSPLDEVQTPPLVARMTRKGPDEIWGPHDHDEPHQPEEDDA